MARTTNPWTTARRHLTRRDPVLAKLITAVGPCTLRPGGEPFTLLVRAVVSQLISTQAAQTVSARLLSLAGPTGLTPKRLQEMGEDGIRQAGLSGPKARAILALSTGASDGSLPLNKLDDHDDEALSAILLALPGIGPWTVDMFLLFGLGRPDILPVGDFGLRAGVRDAYGLKGLPSKTELRSMAEPWRPYRGIATWYIWRSKGAVPQS
jgi:DNA-3-methyladenine glycosylase II